MSIDKEIVDENLWRDFLEYKIAGQHISRKEEKKLREFIECKGYLHYGELMSRGEFPQELAKKSVISKEGVSKKRVVYSYCGDTSLVLKFMAHRLNKYDYIFSDNCYSFRRGYGVGDAMYKFRNNPDYAGKFCYKVDVSDYFNSIDVKKLLDKLHFIKDDDEILYGCIERILLENRIVEKGNVVEENHGAMAGLPIAPFFANVYLTEVDRYFCERQVSYFRYSDDIIMFADSKGELVGVKGEFEEMLLQHGLTINEAKLREYEPYEKWEFLGFSYNNGEIDLSENTKRKIKAKIKRKAEALRRWQRKKELEPRHGVVGFINAMNQKFFGSEEDEFTWARWFFPYLTTDESLVEIDRYVQQYARYIFTGRHYKGNYRTSYEDLKKLGYRTLVNEYWKRNESKPVGE